MTRKVAVTAVKKSQATMAWAILQESGPALVSRSVWPGQLFAVLGDGARREPNLELQQQFIGDAFFSPGWILSR
jgi:hypothetical protein